MPSTSRAYFLVRYGTTWCGGWHDGGREIGSPFSRLLSRDNILPNTNKRSQVLQSCTDGRSAAAPPPGGPPACPCCRGHCNTPSSHVAWRRPRDIRHRHRRPLVAVCPPTRAAIVNTIPDPYSTLPGESN